jgi:hypothetical protein
LGATSLLAGEADTNSGKSFYVGQSSFPAGDLIQITSVGRFPDRIVVQGHYELVSADSAQLALYTTTKAAISVPTDQSQLMRISKGKGDFELSDPNLVPGWQHVTMYSVPGGRPFAGVYFGTKEEAAEESKMQLDYHRRAEPELSAPAGLPPGSDRPDSASGPNQALLEYLQNPVEPPASLDARYTKEGLTKAIQLAAGKAGIKVKKVAIEDSEYPFLVGVICVGSDFGKLQAQIKKMDGYGYTGSIGNDRNSDGSDTCNVFTIVPYGAYPPGTERQIGHRLMLRQQVFYDKINGGD